MLYLISFFSPIARTDVAPSQQAPDNNLPLNLHTPQSALTGRSISDTTSTEEHLSLYERIFNCIPVTIRSFCIAHRIRNKADEFINNRIHELDPSLAKQIRDEMNGKLKTIDFGSDKGYLALKNIEKDLDVSLSTEITTCLSNQSLKTITNIEQLTRNISDLNIEKNKKISLLNLLNSAEDADTTANIICFLKTANSVDLKKNTTALENIFDGLVKGRFDLEKESFTLNTQKEESERKISTKKTELEDINRKIEDETKKLPKIYPWNYIFGFYGNDNKIKRTENELEQLNMQKNQLLSEIEKESEKLKTLIGKLEKNNGLIDENYMKINKLTNILKPVLEISSITSNIEIKSERIIYLQTKQKSLTKQLKKEVQRHAKLNTQET